VHRPDEPLRVAVVVQRLADDLIRLLSTESTRRPSQTAAMISSRGTMRCRFSTSIVSTEDLRLDQPWAVRRFAARSGRVQLEGFESMDHSGAAAA
jgi:hypothetical protein